MSLTTKLTKVKTALLTVRANETPVPCYHYTRPANAAKNCIVWAELAEEDSFNAENEKAEQQIYGAIDYFTQTEFDTVLDGIQAALDAAKIGYRLESVQYEDETKLIHYEWRFWVA